MHLLGVGFNDFSKQLDNFANKSGETQRQVSALVNDITVQLGFLPTTFNKIATEAGGMFTKFLTADGAFTPIIAKINNLTDSERKLVAVLATGTAGLLAMKAAYVALNAWKAMEIKNNEILASQQIKQGIFSTVNLSLNNKGFKSNFVDSFNSIRELSKSTSRLSRLFTGLNKRFGFFTAIGGTAKVLFNTLGSALGKLAATIAGVFTPLNLIIGGIAAIGAVALDYTMFGKAGDSLSEMVEDTITTRLFTKLFQAFDTGAKRAEEAIKRMERVLELKKLEKDSASWAENFIKADKKRYAAVFDSLGKTSQQEFQDIIDRYNTTMKDLHGDKNTYITDSAVEKAQHKYQAAIKSELLLYEKQRKYAEMQQKIETAKRDPKNRKYVPVSGGRDYTVVYTKAVTDLEKQLKNMTNPTEAMVKASREKVEKTRKAFEEIAKQREKQTAAEIAAAGGVVKWADQVIEGINNVRNSFADIKFSMLSSAKQQEQMESDFTNSYNNIINDMKKTLYTGDSKTILRTLESFGKNYRSVIQNIQKQIEDAKRFAGQISDYQFDIDMKYGKSEAEKQKLIKKRMDEYQTEYSKALESKDFSKAFSALKGYENMGTKLSEAMKKLVDAEKRAIDETEKLILSMNKFQNFNVKGVSATGTDAAAIQNRTFVSIPKQIGTGTNVVEEENDWAAKLKDMADSFSKVNDENLKNLNEKNNDYTSMMTDVMQRSETLLDKIEKNTKEMVDKAKVKTPEIKIEVVNI
jgi:hypothetical protein